LLISFLNLIFFSVFQIFEYANFIKELIHFSLDSILLFAYSLISSVFILQLLPFIHLLSACIIKLVAFKIHFKSDTETLSFLLLYLIITILLSANSSLSIRFITSSIYNLYHSIFFIDFNNSSTELIVGNSFSSSFILVASFSFGEKKSPILSKIDLLVSFLRLDRLFLVV